MPRWPGPLLVIGGGLLLVASYLSATGLLDLGDPALGAALALAGGLAFVTGLVYVAVRQVRVRRERPPERYRGPSVFVLLALVFVIAGLLTAPFGGDALAITRGEGELSFAGSIVILVSTQAALLLVTWLFVVRPRALAGLPTLPGPDPLRAVRAGLGWGVVGWIVATLVGGVVVLLLEQLGIEAAPQTAEVAMGLVEPWLVVVAFVVLAPIAEEAFFRGVVFNAWLREAGRGTAILGSALLFGLIHLSLAAFVPIVVLGIILARVYDRTRNLLAPIILHATFNAITVAIALLVRYEVIRPPV